jgi:glucosamine--fructose-6-phosphate aminotransferase (isomerizing)
MSEAALTAMARETAEAPAAVARQFAAASPALQALGERLRRDPPPVVVTCARGSSDHAAGYLKYLVEIVLGIPCCSMGASVVSVYDAPLKVKDALFVTISQSGRSPDILALQAAARKAGAYTAAFVNDETSPAAAEADLCVPLLAGPETSVAATKSLVASLAAAAQLVARWSGDAGLLAAVERLPETLAREPDEAGAARWSEAAATLAQAQSLYVLGRGPSLPIAFEAALKLKETCALHAEAFSAAEVMHGPMELVDEAFPVLAFSAQDRSREGFVGALERLRGQGAALLAVEPGPDAQGRLPYADPGHPLLEPVAMIQAFYRCAEQVARLRGRDPDRPRSLKKVTETV